MRQNGVIEFVVIACYNVFRNMSDEVSVMDIYVRIKAIGKRKDILAPTPYEIPEGICSLRQLLTAVVQKEVAQYNNKEREAQLIPFLTQQELEDQAVTGKVSFGTIYSDKKVDPNKAVANAIQCWEDGLVRVFINDEELTSLDALLAIEEQAVFTFIRLTFLAGSVW
jgi:hypothetical protein